MAIFCETQQVKNPLEMRLGYQLRRVSSAIMTALAHNLSALGLTPTEASILLLIERNTALTQSDIGRELGIKRANMVPITAGLEKAGLIIRQAIDGRSFSLAATDEGKRIAAAADQIMEDQEEALFATLSERAGDLMRDGLQQLIAGIPD